MKITLVQSAGALHDIKVNFLKARMRINNVDSDMFIFPEMFCSGYVLDKNDMHLAKLHDKVISQISELSVNRGSAVICGSPMEIDGKVFNSALLIDGEQIHRYDKMILKDFEDFDESKVFATGNEPMIIDHDGLLIGMMVGEDVYSPQLFRFYAENDVDMIVCIAAFTAPEMDKAEPVVLASAMEYAMPIMLCNMTGSDPGKTMVGRSKFIGSDGTVMESCSEGSDLREIRIDIDSMKQATRSRKLAPMVDLKDCQKVESHSGEGANPVPKCPITGK